MSNFKLTAVAGLGLATAAWALDAQSQTAVPAAQSPAQPVSAQPTSAQPASAQPASAQPASAQPMPAPGPGAAAPAPPGAAASAAAAEYDQPRSDGSAEERVPSGFEAGLRLGVGAPLGAAGRDSDGADRNVKDLASLRFPIWVDVGYRASPRATYGGYVQFGMGSTGVACTDDCDWTDLRIGAEAAWHLHPSAASGALDPWLGIGLGWESLSFRTLALEPTTNRIVERLAGPELLLQAGLDFKVEPSLELGPYLSATLSDYIADTYKCSPDPEACPASSSVDGSAVHAWIGIGLRGTYVP